MKYTVRPIIREGCNCEDCRAGRHIYELFRWRDTGWQWAATSLQTYASAEDCKRQHCWGIVFDGAIWEDGSPVVEPHAPQPATEGMVALDAIAFQKAAGSLEKHWPDDSVARDFIIAQPDLPHPEPIRRFIMTIPLPDEQDSEDGGTQA